MKWTTALDFSVFFFLVWYTKANHERNAHNYNYLYMDSAIIECLDWYRFGERLSRQTHANTPIWMCILDFAANCSLLRLGYIWYIHFFIAIKSKLWCKIMALCFNRVRIGEIIFIYDHFDLMQQIDCNLWRWSRLHLQCGRSDKIELQSRSFEIESWLNGNIFIIH